MAWIDTSQNVCSFSLVSDAGNGANPVCLDVFPSRIAFTGDPDDLLGALLAASLDSVEHVRWNRHMLADSERGFAHPCGTVEPGGLFVHAGAPLPRHSVFRIQQGRVHTPDGRVFDAAGFGYGPVFDTAYALAHHKRKVDASLPTVDPAANVAIGALRACHGMPVAHPIGHIRYLMGALLFAWNASRPRRFGQDTRKAYEDMMGRVADDACNTWALRGDRPYAPTCYHVMPHLLGDAPDALSQAHQDAGFAAARIVLALPPHAYDTQHAWMGGDVSYLSAHQQLALREACAQAIAVFRPLARLRTPA